MSSAGKIARRTLLIGSAAVAGGVAFGVWRLATPFRNPLADDLPAGAATFNPWVLLTDRAITLITPHADLGQGAAHLQALLIAEEMDLDFGQFETSFGQPAAAYYNHTLVAEGAPFETTDRSPTAEATRTALNGLGKLIGLQGTGGSTSVPDSFDKLREAGAVARETLKAAAAQRFGEDADTLKTRAGAVWLPDGTEVPYQTLAGDAANIDPVATPALRPPDRWRLIGQPTERTDMVAKSTGTQFYGIDIQLPDMVHASVRLSPTREKAEYVDTAAAFATEGVSQVMPVSGGFAVVADNTWAAIQGARAIEVTWEGAAYPAEQEDHWAILKSSFTPERLDRVWRDDGDASIAHGSGIEAEYRAPYVAHQPLEPLNATVLVTEDRVDVWAAHQMPRLIQWIVSQVTGHALRDVHFHNQMAGGSFGHRLEFENIVTAAEIADQMRDTPVKLTYSREEDFARDFPRHIGLGRLSGSIANGHVQSLNFAIASPSPIASQMDRASVPLLGPDPQIPAGAWNAPYAIRDFRVRAYRAEGLAPVSSWRSVGASVCGFMLESFLDELIHTAGADPMEERLRLCNWKVACGVLEAVAEMSNWGAVVPAGRGRGLALVESFGVPVAQVIEVSDRADGIAIDRVWVAADAGQLIDPVNFENQVQGGIIWGLGHAMNSEVTFADGRIEQRNYYDAEGMRQRQAPRIEVRALENNFQIRGIGEPPVPPAAPALANAIFAATGKRLREMPFSKSVDFV